MKRFWFTFFSCAVMVFCFESGAGNESVAVRIKAARAFLQRPLPPGLEGDLEREARQLLAKTNKTLNRMSKDDWDAPEKEISAAFAEFADANHKLGRMAYGKLNFDAALIFFHRAMESVGSASLDLLDNDILPIQYNREIEHIFQTAFDAGMYWESKGQLEKAYYYFDKANKYFDIYDLKKATTSSLIVGSRYYALLHRMQSRPKGYCWQIL